MLRKSFGIDCDQKVISFESGLPLLIVGSIEGSIITTVDKKTMLYFYIILANVKLI